MSRIENRVAADPIGSVEAACHDAYRAAWEELDTRAARPLLAAIESARTALVAAGAEVESSGEKGAAKLAEYRRRVSSEVLEPIIRVGEASVPVRQIERVMTEAQTQALADVGRLPESVPLAWGAQALASRSRDSVWRGLGKPVAKVFSAARKPEGVRAAPVRAVAARHLRERVIGEQNRLAASAMRAWSVWFASLEDAWTEWGEVALPILTSPDTAGADPEAWGELKGAEAKLENALESLGEASPHQGIVEDATNALGATRGAIESDLGVAGSWLFRAGPAPTPRTEPLARASGRWVAWIDRALARMQLQRALLAMLSGTYGVQARLGARITKACLEPTSDLPRLADELKSLADGLSKVEATRGSAEAALQSSRARAEELVTEVAATAPRSLDVVSAVQQVADGTVEALQAMVRQMPQRLVLRPSTGGPVGRTAPEGRPLALQELTRHAFDALRVERVRSAAMGLVEDYQTLRVSVDGLAEVVAFGFDAANEEMDDSDPESVGRALAMAAEALHRVAETTGGVPAAVAKILGEAQAEVAEEITEGCESILERAGARGVQAQFLAAQSQFSELRRRAFEAVAPTARNVARWARAMWARLRRLVSLGVRRGSEIVGTEVETGTDAARSLRRLGDGQSLGDSVPLVYRKLFAAEPLSDPALLVARERPLADALWRWRRWKNEDGVPLIVRGRPGVGLTSFLNALGRKIEDAGGRVVRTDPSQRLGTEADLATMLAEVLEVDPGGSIDELARNVLRAPPDTIPDAVVLDGLEHLYLRVPGGTDVLERLLTFMAETEPRVFWIGGITTSAWQFIAKAEPTAVSQVDGLELPQLSVSELREVVLGRHRRSGLSVRYEEPSEGRRLLKRRLRRLRGTERHQQVLEEDFFERLNRASEGTLGLALHQWLAGADFTAREGEVLMRPLELPDFAVLAGLDLTQNFTLKGLLEHRTLTLGEHDMVFRMPRQESYQVFESLGNRNIIEAVPDNGSRAAESEILEGLRYRIRPVLIGAVLNHLQSRNIVH